MSEFDYCPQLQRILQTGQIKPAESSEIEVVGGTTQNNLRILRHFIQSEKCHDTLEIGLAYGVSALCVLSSLAEFSNSENFHHTAIDPFQTSDFQSVAVSQIKEAGFSNHFSLFEKPSALILPDLLSQQQTFDLIYVDGSHLFEDAFVDFYFCWQLLNVGGVIVFDDCTDPHLRKLIRFIERNFSGIVERLPIDESVVKLDWKRKIARKLDRVQAKAFRKISSEVRKWDSPFIPF